MIVAGIISFIASVIGAISGIGGGIIIRPVLDMAGALTPSQISFLSGCTVLAMTMISVGKAFSSGNMEIDVVYGTPLALGACIGGCAGKMFFSYAESRFESENGLGLLQAALLFVMIAGTAVYMLWEKKIKTRHVKNKAVSAGIGLALGLQSAFLGIGGGPVNLVVLSYFFSMERKKASLNSLYIILFSQICSFAVCVLGRNVPSVSGGYLAFMILGGALGGVIGSCLYRRMMSENISRMFMGVLFLLLVIDARNIIVLL